MSTISYVSKSVIVSAPRESGFGFSSNKVTCKNLSSLFGPSFPINA
jgi:hypothetical protein